MNQRVASIVETPNPNARPAPGRYRPRHGRRQRQTGLTLVELMVAAVVSLILLGGVIQIFVSNKQAYRVQDQLGLLQENGRFGTEILAKALRLADHWGGVEATSVTGNPTTSGPGACNQAWINNVDRGIQGFEGAASIGAVAGFPAGCIGAGDYVPNSDLVVVRYADPDGVVADANLNTGGNGSRPFVRAAVGLRAQLLRGSDTIPVILPAQAGTYNFPYQVEVYFLRPCSRKAGATCTGADDGGDPIPTLARLAFNGSALQQEALVEGVEQMQIRYGTDTDGDGDTDRYDVAGAISTDPTVTPNWGQVVSAEFSLVARARQSDPLHSDANTYTMVGHSYTPSTAQRPYHRQQYTRVIQIRNRTRQ